MKTGHKCAHRWTPCPYTAYALLVTETLSYTVYTSRFRSYAAFIRSATDCANSLHYSTVAHASSPFLTSAPNRLVTSHSALLGVSAQIHSVTIPASGSRLHIHSYNILGSVAEMVATVSNVVGMIVSGIMTSLSACRA